MILRVVVLVIDNVLWFRGQILKMISPLLHWATCYYMSYYYAPLDEYAAFLLLFWISCDYWAFGERIGLLFLKTMNVRPQRIRLTVLRSLSNIFLHIFPWDFINRSHHWHSNPILSVRVHNYDRLGMYFAWCCFALFQFNTLSVPKYKIIFPNLIKLMMLVKIVTKTHDITNLP